MNHRDAPSGVRPLATAGLVRYVNLTSGLEFAEPGDRLVRIQSTHLEQVRLWDVIRGVDYGFLMDAAIHGVLLIDGWSRCGPLTRAQWYGVPWVQFAYRQANGLPVGPIIVRGHNVATQWLARWKEAPSDVESKLRYVRRMTGAAELTIVCEAKRSTLDGDYPALSGCLRAVLR